MQEFEKKMVTWSNSYGIELGLPSSPCCDHLSAFSKLKSSM